jgi:N6-adenosine-specific RNA methylase IME4
MSVVLSNNKNGVLSLNNKEDRTTEKYQIIYADPPWKFKNYNDNTAHYWAGEHYDLMETNQIQALGVSQIASDNCVLFLWVTFPMLPLAFYVIKSWGFEYKTVAFVWVKQNRKGYGFYLGMGYWTRSNAEICLLAVKGKPKRVGAGVRQLVLSPLREHSRKPDEVRERIVQLCGDLPRIELFARRKVEGWDCWGNEVESDIDFLNLNNREDRNDHRRRDNPW